MTLPTAKRLAREYGRGATLRALADKYGVNESTIRHHLRGVVETRRSGPPSAPATDDEIVTLRDSGMSWQAVADQVGMSRTGVRIRYAQATEGARPWR